MKCYFTSANFAGRHRIHCISVCSRSYTPGVTWSVFTRDTPQNIPFLYPRCRNCLPTEHQVTKLSLQICLKKPKQPNKTTSIYQPADKIFPTKSCRSEILKVQAGSAEKENSEVKNIWTLLPNVSKHLIVCSFTVLPAWHFKAQKTSFPRSLLFLLTATALKWCSPVGNSVMGESQSPSLYLLSP